ncbi:transposable element Tcb2 transposase [Trichonephila clavipes]|nr:transposable element Tcb2 transposase [Trichonephila clavipes]
MGRRCETCLTVREIISPTKDWMFLAGHPSQGCFGLQSHCAPCYFFNQASFYASDFSFTTRGLLATDHVILNHGQVTWTTPLAPPSPNYHTTPTGGRFSSTDLTCIAALHGGSLVVLGSNS